MNTSKQGRANWEKGLELEEQVEFILKKHHTKFKRNARMKGYGKGWNVDFFLPEENIIIECKNIGSKNIRTYLRDCCLKAIDIRKTFKKTLQFIIVFPKQKNRMGALGLFLTKYDIKLINELTNLISSFKQETQNVNQPIFCHQRKIVQKRREEELVSLIKEKPGINTTQLAKKTDTTYSVVIKALRHLVRKHTHYMLSFRPCSYHTV